MENDCHTEQLFNTGVHDYWWTDVQRIVDANPGLTRADVVSLIEQNPGIQLSDVQSQIEQAIAKKYGNESVQNPKANWTDEKEKEYLDELKKIYNSSTSQEGTEEEVNGVFISKKLLKRESKRSCPVCNVYSFKSNDDIYMSKFECCEKCYIQWVEGREERWKTGWRPKNEINN